jgi:hypothetical protein
MFRLLFPPRVPRVTLCGLSLSQDEATQLLTTTDLLITMIPQQIPCIALFEAHFQHGLRPRLEDVQRRQQRFHFRLSDLVKATKGSGEPWLRELMDGQEAILRKVRTRNRMSSKEYIGWKMAALKYWPLIAETFETLRPVLQRFKHELETALEDPETWAGNARLVPGEQTRRPSIIGWFASSQRLPIQGEDGKKVTFCKEVEAKWLNARDEPEKIKDASVATLPLTTDKKRTAGNFKKEKATRKMRKGGQESRDEEELEEYIEGLRMEDEIAPIPL